MGKSRLVSPLLGRGSLNAVQNKIDTGNEFIFLLILSKSATNVGLMDVENKVAQAVTEAHILCVRCTMPNVLGFLGLVSIAPHSA